MARLLVISNDNKGLVLESDRPARLLEDDARCGRLDKVIPADMGAGSPRVYRLENLVVILYGRDDGAEAEQGQPTGRQRQILLGLAAGKTGKQIARELRITVRTVDFHIAVMKERLEAATRVEMMGKARERGWI